MRLPHRARRLAAPFVVVFLSAGSLIGASAAASAAASASGTAWVRCAHLSPNTQPVDVYLYSFGNPKAEMVLKHVKYGDVSSYMAIASGQYTVAMRAAGAKPTSSPVLSTSVRVAAGASYTVAGMGPASGLRLQVLTDRMSSPPGRALVRVIQASLQEHKVDVSDGSQVLAKQLSFATVTSYRSVSPGQQTVRVTGGADNASQRVILSADTIHTFVVLDSASGLKLDSLEDAAGSHTMPAGGAGTGLGGTAPRSSSTPWLAGLAAGGLLVAAGAVGLRRIRGDAVRVP
jgi:Domain of unknown function (DUF4397)